MKKELNKEFYNIVKDILNHKEFIKLKKINHHSVNRYDHSLDVSYRTFLLAKKYNLNVREATRGALLHDFFFEDQVKNDNKEKKKLLKEHPLYAVNNSKKYFKISKLEEEIIKTHMFPVNRYMPKHKESILVNIIDDYVSIREFFNNLKNKTANTLNVLILYTCELAERYS